MSRSCAIIPITYTEIVKDTNDCTWSEHKQIGVVETTDLLGLLDGMRKIQGEIHQ